jgi:ribosomal protein L17
MAILQVPVTKAGKTAFIELDTETMPEGVWAEIILQGAKVLLNRGASKITKETYPDETERQAEAMKAAEKQLEDMVAGKIKLTGTKKASAKTSGKVMTEARRLAREVVKDLMKANGIKISHVKASEITAVANDLINQDPTFIEKAEANLAAREAIPTTAINIKDLIKVDPKLVAADEVKKAKAKANAPLSAKQAGKTKARAKTGASA